VNLQRLVRLGDGLATLVFLLGAVVQINDPDPVPWMTIYVAAAVACTWWPSKAGGLGRAGVAVVAVVWGCAIAAAGLGPISTEELLGDLTMKTPNVEAWREMLGLFLIAAWLMPSAGLALRGPRPTP
jgi:hypothetical protein